MDKKKISHDIQNLIERLRIMHEIARDQNWKDISQTELATDLAETLQSLKQNFEKLIQ